MNALSPTGRTGSPWGCFHRRGLAFCAMLAMALFFRADHLTDWDSWDYAAQAVAGHSSDLLLGRWWFIATMRGAYLAGRAVFALSAMEAYLAMQAACSLLMAGAVVAGMAWTYRLTRSAAAEILFAAMAVPGTTIGIYASSVMTESMTLLTLSLAMLLWEWALAAPGRGAFRALLAGVCFGVAVDIREPVGLLCAWPILSCILDRSPRRGRLLAAAAGGAVLTLGIGVLGAWAWYPAAGNRRTYWQNVVQWTRWMTAERGQYGVSLAENLKFLFVYAGAASAAATLMLAPAVVWARLRARRLFWMAVATLPFVASLLLDHDLNINPRRPLPAAWMILPVAAGAAAAWVAARGRYRVRLATALGLVLALEGGVLLGSWGLIDRYYLAYAAGQRRLLRAMGPLPRDAVVIAGPGTAVAGYLSRIGEKGFTIIGSGWGWPGEGLGPRIEQELSAGKSVYANLDEEDWKRTTRKSGEWDQLVSALAGRAGDPSAWPMVRILRRPTSTSASAQTQRAGALQPGASR